MAYTTDTKVKVLLTGVATVNAQFITMAENIINGKLASKYAVPFTGTTPPLIETLATDIAAYFCMRTLFTDDSQNKSDWTTTFKESMKILDDIAAGKIPVVDAAGLELARSIEPMYSNNKDYNPVFDVDAVEDQQIDTTRLEDIANSKE
jgi:phage gp36-like protein